MAWVRVDDSFYDHPKFQQLTPAAIGLWAVALAWAARNLTDGHIPAKKARILLDFDGLAIRQGSGEMHEVYGDLTASSAIDELVDAGLWIPAGDGYQIHDFLELNPSAEQVIARRDKDRRRKASRPAPSLPLESTGDPPGPDPGSAVDSARNPSGSPPRNPAPPHTPIDSSVHPPTSQTERARPEDEEEDEIGRVWERFGRLKLDNTPGVKNPSAWRRKVVANARTEIGDGRVRELLDGWVLTTDEVALVLVSQEAGEQSVVLANAARRIPA